MKATICSIASFVIIAAAVSTAIPASAAVHFGVSGTVSTTNLGLQTDRKQSGKGSVAIDLGSYFRVGYSFQKRHEREDNYRQADANSPLYRTESTVIQDTHAVDLIAILYAGELFTPFAFIGAAWKQYDIETYDEEEGRKSASLSLGPVENYGGGLAISLNRDFSLKITTTWSPGWKVDPDDPDGNGQKVRDVQTDIGISYKLR